MDGEAEKVGEEIASEITDAIETANERSEQAAEIVEVLTDAALEGERGRRVESLERDMNECLQNQAELSEAVAGMALQLTEMQGQISTLLALGQSTASPPVIVESVAEDGQKESREEIQTVIVAPEAEAVEIPPVQDEKPARKKRRWI